MVFFEDELHCDIFALVLIIQRIFVGPCELADMSHVLFFSSIVVIVLGPSVFYILSFQSQIPHMFLTWLFEPMRGVIHFRR